MQGSNCDYQDLEMNSQFDGQAVWRICVTGDLLVDLSLAAILGTVCVDYVCDWNLYLQ